LGVSIYYLTKKDNNESDYYLYINEDLVKDTYYYGEDFEFAQNMNIATLCKKEDSNTVYASSLSNGKNKEGQEIDNKDLTIEGFDSDTHGKKAVKISYKQYSKVIEVDIKDCSITNISVINESNLFVGEKVDKLNLQIEYSDGHIIYDEYNHLGIDTSTTGTKVKNIYYPFYSFSWEYSVYEFDDSCFYPDTNVEYPLGYTPSNKLNLDYVDYSATFDFSRRIPASADFDCSTLGEKTINLTVKKSDIFNNPLLQDEILVPFTYNVKYAKSLSYSAEDWFGINEIPSDIHINISMENNRSYGCNIPLNLTDDDKTIGEHSYTINFAGQSTIFEYTIVDVESVETYNWEDVYYYHPTQKEKILLNYEYVDNSNNNDNSNSDNNNSNNTLDKFNSLNKDHDFIENGNYDGLDMPDINSKYEYIINENLYADNYYYLPNYIITDFNINGNFDLIYNGNLVFYAFLNYNFYITPTLPVKVNYTNGKSKVINLSKLNDNINCDEKIVDCSKLGENTLTFTYLEKSFSYTYQVKKLQSISVVDVEKVYDDMKPNYAVLNVKATDDTSNNAYVEIKGYFAKNNKSTLYFEYLEQHYTVTLPRVAIEELICKDDLTFIKNQTNIELNFTVKYKDNSSKDIKINFDNKQIDTSQPTNNATFKFIYSGKEYSFNYDVLDYEVTIKEESKTATKNYKYTGVNYIVTYSNGETIEKSYRFLYKNQIDTSVAGLVPISVDDGIHKFSYELIVLDYEVVIKDAYKSVYQGADYHKVEYSINYSNGTTLEKTYSFSNKNNVNTLLAGTIPIKVDDGAHNFTFNLTVLPLVDTKIQITNSRTYILGEKATVSINVLDSSDNVLYTKSLDEYLDTSVVENNIEKTYTYLGMSDTITYNVLDIGQIVFKSKRVYYVGEEFTSLNFVVASDLKSNTISYLYDRSYSISLNPEDLDNFDISNSKLGVNTLTFTYCGYEIDFVYYYGEKGSVELQENTFVIERTADKTIYSLHIPMLITIGDYQFIDNSAVGIHNINEKDAGTYTYKFMYDDQEFEITYTIVDAE